MPSPRIPVQEAKVDQAVQLLHPVPEEEVLLVLAALRLKRGGAHPGSDQDKDLQQRVPTQGVKGWLHAVLPQGAPQDGVH